MKVLFDSNIHISDAIYGGAAARAIEATLNARWIIFVCETILTEVNRIIGIKFQCSERFVRLTIQNTRNTSELADELLYHHHVTADPNDTPILRAALIAGVD